MSNDLENVRKGFESLKVNQIYKEAALKFIEEWITKPEYIDYVPQIKYMISQKYWDYLLDSFYQVIPFGTGGRRGEVGVGPNRINPWTIKSSAQGHSQYLLKQYGESAKTRGVVLAWDVREFFGNQYMSSDFPNPVMNLTGDKLAKAATEVYAANGIKVYMFDGVRTTPELSFAVRYLKAVSGDVFSASHNPPSHNGKKVYDEFGGQLVPPDDEALVYEVTQNVKQIKHLDFEQVQKEGLVIFLNSNIDDAYVEAATAVSLSKSRGVRIAYTPLHGCSYTSVLKVLAKLGFDVKVDPETSNPSGRFEHVTFNIPNPEVIQSFDTPLKFAKQINADILLNTDPDADRIGIMVHHNGEWRFLNGNEIAAILGAYLVSKRESEVGKNGVIIKTDVTTNILREICKAHGMRIIGDLLVGYKYVGAEMNKLEKVGQIKNLLLSCEESHGYLGGNYVRDKDACSAAIWLSELASELKTQGKTLVDYLNETYSRYGYFGTYLTEIRLPGAEGKALIDTIQSGLRSSPPKEFGDFIVEKVEDYWDRTPIVSETDRASKNMLAFHIRPVEGTVSIKVTVRPSGTEPKSKLYIEVGSLPFDLDKIEEIRRKISNLISKLERLIMKYCYLLIGVDFPDRGFLLFWQMPLSEKMKYFEIEPEIVKLRNESIDKRQNELNKILSIFGADPIAKVDEAFAAEYGMGIVAYLELAPQ